MPFKMKLPDGTEREFERPGDATSWGYQALGRINRKISDLIKEKNAIIQEFGLRMKTKKINKDDGSQKPQEPQPGVSQETGDSQPGGS